MLTEHIIHRRCLAFGMPVLATLLLVCGSGCNMKTKAQYDKEFFERQVAEVKAGNTDWIQLYDTENTDALFQSIVDLRGIRRVTLAQVGDITDAGIAAIARLPDLTTIDFHRQRVPKQWLQLLAACPTLVEINVSRSMDWRIAEILAFPNLRRIRLDSSGKQTGDTILAALADATFLEEIELGEGFENREADLLALQRKLPNCQVSLLVRTGNKEERVPVTSFEQPLGIPTSAEP